MWRTLLIAILTVSAAWPAELQVAAAADLAQVEPALLGAAFAKQSGTTVNWVTGSSGLLAKQAENGAPFDVFLSASESYVNDLVTAQAALADTVVIYASGHVGLWMPKHAAAFPIERSVEAGSAARRHCESGACALWAAAKEALESAGLWKKIESKLVYGETVRQALQFGESGNWLAQAVLTACRRW